MSGGLRGFMVAFVFAAAIVPACAEDAGKRDFPATLVVDEPQVETEVSPQIAAWGFGDGRRVDASSELSVQLLRSLSFIISPVYTRLRPGGAGFQALGLGTKYQLITNAPHELVLSLGLSSTIGGTGSLLVGADAYSSLIPTIYFGKGAGDLPERMAWARPLALTGEIGYQLPLQRRSTLAIVDLDDAGSGFDNPAILNLSGSLQYSFPYARENVPEIAMPAWLSKAVPLVEFDLDVPIHSGGARLPILGTINPGLLWVDEDHHVTWGLELFVPINRTSGSHPGARLQFSYSFDPPWRLIGPAPL